MSVHFFPTVSGYNLMRWWRTFSLPLQPVGRMVLNRTIDNFFAENEQLAFCPGLVVPGIYYSDDKMLQTRIFSYSDTQRHRLGPNYLMLPVNAPKCAFHNNHHEGFMNFMHRDEEVGLVQGDQFIYYNRCHQTLVGSVQRRHWHQELNVPELFNTNLVAPSRSHL